MTGDSLVNCGKQKGPALTFVADDFPINLQSFRSTITQKIGVVTNTRAVWETARGMCSAPSERRSRSDRASGRERVNINGARKIGVVTNYDITTC
jgi:hypothetical protein